MNPASLFRYGYLAYLSQPAADRSLYRVIRRQRVARIVELGVGMGQRAVRMIELARCWQSQPVHYTGIDQFEARPGSQPGVTLKRAHRLLGRLGAKVRLVPGEPLPALARVSNLLLNTDLLIIAADQQAESLRDCWFYVPRMLHQRSLVFLEEPSQRLGCTQFRRISRHEVEQLAARCGRAYRRAA